MRATSTFFSFLSVAQRERRHHDRHDINAQAMLLNDNDESLGIVWCRDISRAGLRLETSRSVPPGSQVSVRLNTTGGSELKLAGSVVRVEGESVGVRFFAQDWFSGSALSDLVNRMRADLQMVPLVSRRAAH